MTNIRVAFFSMEVAIESSIPTYAGGLGVLSGDVLRAAADLGMPMAGISLVHRRGSFRQRLDAHGEQTEEPLWASVNRIPSFARRSTPSDPDRS